MDMLSHPAWTFTVSWLLTYGLHSTVLLGGVWVIGRLADRLGFSRPDPIWREFLWKAALVGGVATSALSLAGVGVGLVAVDLPVAGTVSGSVGGTGIESTGNGILSSLPLAGIAGVAWLFGVVVLGARRLWTRRSILRALADRRPVSESRVNEHFAELYEGAGHGRVPSVSTVSFMPGGPVALWTDEICLPDWIIREASSDQLKSVLAHELAHLRRRDPWWLQVALIFETVFFFQPLNGLARRRLEHLFECRCDREAVRMTGRRRPLAEILLKVARRPSTGGTAPSVGMAGTPSGLRERISRLASPTDAASGGGRSPAQLAGLGCILVVLAGFGPVVNLSNTTSGPDATTPAAVSSSEHAAEFERLIEKVAPSDRPLVRRLLEHHAEEHHHHSASTNSRSEGKEGSGDTGE